MAWHDGVKTSISRPVWVGLLSLFVGFGGFGAWAAVAPIEGAVIAQGTVIALGRNKLIQHLEGGIIKKILVAEGDKVSAGQPVLLLDGTSAQATRNRIQGELNSLAALEARAVAERSGGEEILFPKALLEAASQPDVAAAIEDQKSEFEARLQRQRAEADILDEQIGAVREEIAGISAQQSSVALQLELTVEAKDDLQSLLDQELVAKTRVLDLKSKEAELIGQAGQLTAAVAKAKQMIAEKEHEKQRLLNARLEEASKALVEVRRQRADLQEQLRTAEDTLARTTVLAPESGTITNLAQLGSGSVISPGQELMEIVPDRADLIVEAHVRPQDIDQVHVGQDARLVFAALNQRETPQVGGEVTYLSADRMENERTGESYYLARLNISAEPLQGFNPKQVGAGQPVEVFITTGQRTFLAYVLDPLAITVTRALRER